MSSLFEVALLVGLQYALFTVGLAISFRVLNYPDLTLEGSMIFGGALSYVALGFGINPFLAVLVGAVGGAVAGLFTAIQHLYLGVSKLLSGIITAAVLYSINIRLLGGRSNVRLVKVQSLFDALQSERAALIDGLILLLFVSIVIVCCTLLFKTRLGLLLRVLGDNEFFVVRLAQNPKHLTIVGLMFANGIIGFGGGLLVQYKNSCDVNMSIGLLLSALAAMVLGEVIVPARRMWQYFVGCAVGTFVYSLAIAVVLFSWSSRWEKLVLTSDVRLVAGLMLIIPIVLRIKRGKGLRLFRSEW